MGAEIPMGAFSLVFQWCTILNKMAAILSKTIGNWDKLADILFRISNDSILEWSRPFQNQTIENPNFRTFGMLMFGIQAPTVFNLIKLGLQKFLIFLMNLAFAIESKFDLCNANLMNCKYI